MSTFEASPTILLVDDDDDIRKNASLILKLEGYHVYSAGNGKEALDMLTEGECRPHLIVSDIAMPIIDGYAFFQAVRQIGALRLVPFIFLTAYGSRRHIRFGRELGVDDYLVKPFDPNDLLAAVRNKLGRIQDLRHHIESEFDGARKMLVQLLSHELRTPLTYITGGVDILTDELETGNGQSQPDMDVSVGLIRNGMRRLMRLAEQVVRYTELTSGYARSQLERVGEPTSLIMIVENALASAVPDLKLYQSSIHHEYRVSPDVEIFCLPDLLSTAVYEVIRNAIYFSGERSEVCVDIFAEDGYGIIRVTDQGCGILPDDQEKIWDIMTQSERPKREQQGAGMGLPVVRQALLLHGGSINLESEPGIGTVVTLALPISTVG